MATGIIIGAAIGTLVGSVVKDVIMPPVGLLLSDVDFSAIKITLKEAIGEEPEVAINIGSFVINLMSFLIVLFVMFMLIRMMNAMRKADEAAKSPEPTASEVYLKEIRDALTKND